MAETVFGVTQTDLCASTEKLVISNSDLARDTEIVPLDIMHRGRNTIELVDCGMPLDGINIEIVDNNNIPLPEKKIGEIAINGTFLFDGYNKEPNRTSDSLVNGTYYSKDLGFMYLGKLYVLGRVDDLVIVNGRNAYAHQIEALVNSIEGIKKGRSVAFPIFDEKSGSDHLVILAEKINDPSVSSIQLITEVKNTIFSQLNIMPNNVEIVPLGSLFKTSSGKLSRSENSKRYLAANTNMLKEAS